MTTPTLTIDKNLLELAGDGKTVSDSAIEKCKQVLVNSPSKENSFRQGTKMVLGALLVCKSNNKEDILAGEISKIVEELYNVKIYPNAVGDILGRGCLQLFSHYGRSKKTWQPLSTGRKHYRIDYITVEHIEEAIQTQTIPWLGIKPPHRGFDIHFSIEEGEAKNSDNLKTFQD